MKYIDEYNSKRDFSHTSEPKGKVAPSGSKLRFVIQKHQASHLHYDFRLEMDGVMKSWAVPKGPNLDPSVKRLAMMVEDHPISYNKFEGIIPKGNYGGGTVMVWDEGIYEPTAVAGEKAEHILLKGLHKGQIDFIMHGKKIRGAWSLVKLRGNEENSWLLVKQTDEFASKEDNTKMNLSAKTGRTMADIAVGKKGGEQLGFGQKISGKKANMPQSISPMLATLTDKPFNRKDWLYEVKWDGYRAIATIGNGKVSLVSRNQNAYTKFSTVLKSLSTIKETMVLDGEVVILDDSGKPQFNLLQNYSHAYDDHLLYVVFDILYYNRQDLRGLSLRERRHILITVLPKMSHIMISEGIEQQGSPFFDAVIAEGLEGVIAKDLTSRYEEGSRSLSWLKIKATKREEAIIVGFTKPRGGRKAFGALVLGQYQNGKLTYIGHTGGGFTDRDLQLVFSKLEPFAINTSAFENPPKTNMPVTWVEPKLLCEVKFSEWTKDGLMRHPVFMGLREDKKLEEVTREAIVRSEQVLGLKGESRRDLDVTTNEQKVYFPEAGYTKGDVIEYYKKISPYIMPYLKDRPMSLLRMPNGITGSSFFQKDITNGKDWMQIQPVYSESEARDIHYLVCKDEGTLLYMAKMGCIEMNPWNSRVEKLEYPDYMIIDLDPEDIGFDAVLKVALEVHTLLGKIAVPHYPKTSGKTGIHIMIPMGAKYTYDQIKMFGHLIVLFVYRKLSDITSVERSPSKRQKKVYLDYLQNRIGQTLAAPYSLRPTPEATVATPLDWSEVHDKLNPKNFTIKTIGKRLKEKGDLFKPILGEGIDLKKAIENLSKL